VVFTAKHYRKYTN